MAENPINVHGRSDGKVQTVISQPGVSETRILQTPDEAEAFGTILIREAKWCREHARDPYEPPGVYREEEPPHTPILCKHCGFEIFTNDGGKIWWHGSNGVPNCEHADTTAQPSDPALVERIRNG